MTAPLRQKALHDHYVRAINAALAAGRDRDAQDLAEAYALDLTFSDDSRVATAA